MPLCSKKKKRKKEKRRLPCRLPRPRSNPGGLRSGGGTEDGSLFCRFAVVWGLLCPRRRQTGSGAEDERILYVRCQTWQPAHYAAVPFGYQYILLLRFFLFVLVKFFLKKKKKGVTDLRTVHRNRSDPKPKWSSVLLSRAIVTTRREARDRTRVPYA